MTIRMATTADVPAVVAMGEKFHAFSGDPVPYCNRSAATTALGLMRMGFIMVAERDDMLIGMIGVAVVPMPFNSAHIMAQEMMWWVDENARSTGDAMRLIRGAEQESGRRGASRFIMGLLAVSQPSVARAYERMGMVKAETSYMKDIKQC
jgi:hypothetical protein